MRILTDQPPREPDVRGAAAVPWQQAFKRAIRHGAALLNYVGLEAADVGFSSEAELDFPVFAPLEWLARVRPGDPHDPLLKQVLPTGDETVRHPGFGFDPLGEQAATVVPGLLHKYAGRALIVVTSACAVHCRYCFRRHFAYETLAPPAETWRAAVDAIASDAQIREVILSGGDPLTLTDASLERLCAALQRVPHVRRLRIHSRLPIVIPQRVDRHLLGWLRNSRLRPIVVVHANHPAEIDAAVAAALRRLLDAGITVLNQAVLLRGINDNVETLHWLCECLADLGVLPYYLHQLDRVAGAAHFEVPVDRGRELIAELRRRLSGYAVPRYVQEQAGQPYKQPLA